MTNCEFVTRRRFLAGLGATAGSLIVGGYAISVFARDPSAPLAVAPSTTMTTAPSALGAPTDRTLVVLELGGGNDGLSMVVPHADDAYYDLRRSTAITDPLDLDGEVGFHPNLPYLADRYLAGDVAIVEGVGYPDPDLSHFISMATWWTASPGFDLHSGWLGRYLDATVGYSLPLAGVTIGPGPSQAMAGERSFAVAIEDISGLQPNLPDWIDDADELIGAWAGMVPAQMDPGLGATLGETMTQTAAARDDLNGRLPGTGAGDGTGARDRRRRTFDRQLELAARLITHGTPPQVIYIHGIGDFDTHENQAGRHGDLMGQLDEGLATFWSAVGEAGMAEDVVLVTASEFGRRARDNGSGTDHGTASTQLVMGPAVAAGRYGQAPALTRTDPAGNLTATVDFRSVYASLLEEWLEVDADEILGARHERLGIIGQA